MPTLGNNETADDLQVVRHFISTSLFALGGA